MEIKTNSDFNKIQINFSEDKTAEGLVIKRSFLCSIRSDTVIEAYKLFTQLKNKLEGKNTPETEKKSEKESKKNDKENAKEKVPNCPKCKTSMVLKTNGKTGLPFWACPQYPICNGTKPFQNRKPDWIPADQDLATADIPF
jgi:hypothetical protein